MEQRDDAVLVVIKERDSVVEVARRPSYINRSARIAIYNLQLWHHFY